MEERPCQRMIKYKARTPRATAGATINGDKKIRKSLLGCSRQPGKVRQRKAFICAPKACYTTRSFARPGQRSGGGGSLTPGPTSSKLAESELIAATAEKKNARCLRLSFGRGCLLPLAAGEAVFPRLAPRPLKSPFFSRRLLGRRGEVAFPSGRTTRKASSSRASSSSGSAPLHASRAPWPTCSPEAQR